MKDFNEFDVVEKRHFFIKWPLLYFVLIDFVLLNGSFFICNYLKRGSFYLLPGYTKLLILFYLCWIVSSFVGGKYRNGYHQTFWLGTFTIVRSNLYLAYCIAFAVVMLGLENYSRLQIFSTCLMVGALEFVARSIYYKSTNSKLIDNNNSEKSSINSTENQLSYFLVVFDLVLVVFSFFVINLMKRGNLNLYLHYEKLLLLILALWFVCSLITKKFSFKDHSLFYFSLWQWIKASTLMLAMASVIVFGLRLFYFSRFQVFGSIVLLTILEIIVLCFYWWSQKGIGIGGNQDIESVEIVKNILEQEKLTLDIDIELIRKKLLEPSRVKIEKKLSGGYSELFEFINQNIDIDGVLNMEATIKNGCDLFVVDSDEMPPVRIFLNMHKINDVRRINQYFLQVHQALLPGGYFIGWAHTIRTHKKWIYSKFPRQIANVVYFFDFCFKRIMPKLKGLKNIYFVLTKGNGRIISRAEVLGRLCFCGFEIIAEKEINKRECFIARKVKMPSLDQNPTYGPIVTLKRVGYNKKIVNIYKLRTMHPYSEYLQQYIYDNFGGLIDGDGFKNDFRITAWGKIFRQSWIDELPMLVNWFRGDVKLVGVRPLSKHKFSLYTEKNQNLRVSVKPGLVPPFYADLPQNFEELQKSEVKYTKNYLKKPFITDFKYFFAAISNIFFRNLRSK